MPRELRVPPRLTREPFAASYGNEVKTLRNRDTAKRDPDTTACGTLRAIANDPGGVGTG